MGVTVNSAGLPSTSMAAILFTSLTVSQLSSAVSSAWPTWTVKAGLQYALLRFLSPFKTMSCHAPSGPIFSGSVLLGM